MSTNIVKMPEEFIKSNGELLYELLGFLTPKKFNHKKLVTTHIDRNELINQLIEQYSDVIIFLQQ